MGRISTFAAFALVLAAGLPHARAQVPTTVGPRTAPAPAPAPAPAAPAPEPVFVPVPADALQQPAADESGFFYLPDDFTYAEEQGIQPGPAPLFHSVRRGDTLWDICFMYFNNPWEWPKIWSYNPEITNPHWIYPGDRVRLYPEGGDVPADAPLSSELPVDVEGGEALPVVQVERPAATAQQQGVRLRQLAFVDQDTRDSAFTIVGAVEEKSMLSEGDSVYLEYPRNNPPDQGERYTIYAETSQVQHPDTERVIGSYVRILGELQVVSVRQGKRARAFITDSVDVIERGAKVGPLQRTFQTVAPARSKSDLQGTIVALVGGEQLLIGQNQVVFVDRGTENGVEVGNRMYVVRRGDAYGAKQSSRPVVGQDDDRFPARAIGEILIVQSGKRVSAALVTLALREFGVGDRVLMRKSSE